MQNVHVDPKGSFGSSADDLSLASKSSEICEPYPEAEVTLTTA